MGQGAIIHRSTSPSIANKCSANQDKGDRRVIDSIYKCRARLRFFEPLASPPLPTQHNLFKIDLLSDPLHGDSSKSAQHQDPRIPQSFDLDNSSSEGVL